MLSSVEAWLILSPYLKNLFPVFQNPFLNAQSLLVKHSKSFRKLYQRAVKRSKSMGKG
ncbi:MAG: hypothetical protein KBF99_18650 [Leptospiraceae bacterium]|nr:hypothetical protein [Leptospiraceae bacterium]